MFLKQTPRPKGMFLQIVESYYDNGTSRQKVIESLGYLNDLKKNYDDPVTYFKNKAKQMTLDKKKENDCIVRIDLSSNMNIDEDKLKNCGYGLFKIIYSELKLHSFWNNVSKKYKIEYPLDSIFQLLLFSRILYPASKKSTFENKKTFFEEYNDFELIDIYRSLDIIVKEERNLQNWIYNHSKDLYSRDLTHSYFYCTNYYFEIENNDEDLMDEEGNILQKGYRKRGVEKNHRHDPIIQMGLLMNSSGIPLAYDIFSGNESEKLHLLPIVNRSRVNFGFERTIIVVDRELNTSDNIFFIAGKNDKDINNRDGYIYVQSIKGADKEFKAWAIDEDGFKITDIYENDKVIKFKHKSRIYPKKIQITRETNDGKTKKQSITVDQKQLVYFSAKYAKKQKLSRDLMVERAKDLIKNPKKYDRYSAKGSSVYVLNINFDKKTGEVIGKNLILDENRIKKEEKYDGYYSIVTSELKMNDIKLRNVYRGLAKIEDTFKVTKSNLESRPVYVWTNESIKAHFLTCFSALLILRLFEKRLKEEYSSTRIIDSLKKYNCINLDGNKYLFTYYDDIIKSCEIIFNIDLSKKYRTRRDMRTLLKY